MQPKQRTYSASRALNTHCEPCLQRLSAFLVRCFAKNILRSQEFNFKDTPLTHGNDGLVNELPLALSLYTRVRYSSSHISLISNNVSDASRPGGTLQPGETPSRSVFWKRMTWILAQQCTASWSWSTLPPVENVMNTLKRLPGESCAPKLKRPAQRGPHTGTLVLFALSTSCYPKGPCNYQRAACAEASCCSASYLEIKKESA